MSWFTQSEYGVRFETGIEGARRLAPLAGVVVIVDVLSFSTCVEIAVSRGAAVFPFRYKDGRAEAFAQSIDATLAHPQRSKSLPSLSPTSLSKIAPGSKLVLPSPNGAAICFELRDRPVLSACLRNAAAVARAAAQISNEILVIAAGEKWPDNSLRPSLEDLIGAGAVISELGGSLSPESAAALAVFHHFRDDLANTINQCSSGQELRSAGFDEDNAIAAALNVSSTVPILRDDAFVAA